MYFKCTLPDGKVEYKLLNDDQLREIIDSDGILDDFEGESWEFTTFSPNNDDVFSIDVRKYLIECSSLEIDEQEVIVENIPDSSYEGLISKLAFADAKKAYLKNISVVKVEEQYEAEDPYSDDPQDYDDSQDYDDRY